MKVRQPRPRSWMRIALTGLGSVVLLLSLLMIPIPEGGQGTGMFGRPGQGPFVWAQDSLWKELEHQFIRSRSQGCDSIARRTGEQFRVVSGILAEVRKREHAPSDPIFSRLEETFFRVGPLVAHCPQLFPEYLRLAAGVRTTVKECSKAWDMEDRTTRATMYRLLYGTRAALEEIMLQIPTRNVPELVEGVQEPSQTPSASLLGVQVHSGDILVSRGGAPTSALIARGNDFPGNFSHVALVHVDPLTRQVRIVESHIERGVAVSSVEEYLRDKKLRVMALRLRADLPAMLLDPQLPHRAAQASVEDALARHIPYDFEMKFDEPSKLFCSEVASAAYATVGVRLWMGKSTISNPGLRSWLGAFGVRYFETQEPSDLEYDPQLSIVAEWRDPETLYQDHVDNAVTEAMLEGAERGEELRYDWYLLSIGRLMKLYSVAKNVFGEEGPVPEGMSAEAALRNRWYSGRHAAACSLVKLKADAFASSKGYRPPYWRLLEMARVSLQELAVNG